MTGTAIEALVHLIRGIVLNPDDVRVEAFEDGVRVFVHPSDCGRVIGRQGNTVKALRTVARALNRGPFMLEIVYDEE